MSGENPKDKIGRSKVSTSVIPPAGTIELALAMMDGAEKYDAFNFRETDISYTIYLDGIDRHRMDVLDGEDFAPDSLVHHLGHIMANCAILLDAISTGRIIDDRPVKGQAPILLENGRQRLRKRQEMRVKEASTVRVLNAPDLEKTLV